MNMLTLCLGLAVAGLGSDSGLTLEGKVTDKAGKPVAQARVQIATAAPRLGQGLFCPSCYRDCAKFTQTDINGKFSIPGLDPTLKFTVLATSPSKKAVQTKLLDPLRGPVELVLVPFPADIPKDRIVQLKLLDDDGKALAGALVHPTGAESNIGRWWGRVNGVDPTVSDADGLVQIPLPNELLAIDLEIDAHGTAGMLLPEQQPGQPIRSVRVPTGARVEAKLLRGGKPVAGARVAVVQLQRTTEHHFVKAIGSVSDQEGTIVFEHLPAAEEYAIYTSAEEPIQAFVLKTKRFKAPTNGQSRNLGTLELMPAKRLVGRVMLPAGQMLPVNSKIALGRDPALDLIEVKVNPDGLFSVEGLPPETYTVRLSAKGFEIDESQIRYQMLEEGAFGLRLANSIMNLQIPMKPIGVPEK